MEGKKVIGVIDHFYLDKKFCFVRDTFILIDDYIFNIKNGKLIDYLKFPKMDDCKWDSHKEIFHILYKEEYLYYKPFPLNNFIIFKFWSFISCFILEKYLSDETLIDPSLFSDIYDFFKIPTLKNFSLYENTQYIDPYNQFKFLTRIENGRIEE